MSLVFFVYLFLLILEYKGQPSSIVIVMRKLATPCLTSNPVCAQSSVLISETVQGISIMSHLHSLWMLSQNTSDLQAIEMYSPQLWRLAVYVQESCVGRFPWALAARLQMAGFSLRLKGITVVWLERQLEWLKNGRYTDQDELDSLYLALLTSSSWLFVQLRWTALLFLCPHHHDILP